MRKNKSLYDSDWIKFDSISGEISCTPKINALNFEVGSRKSEVASRKSQVASLKSEVWSLKSEVWSLKSEVWSLTRKGANLNSIERVAVRMWPERQKRESKWF